jgi:ribonuclease HI
MVVLGESGPGACAAIVRKEGNIIIKSSKFIGENVTNNVAEYEGIILALELASKITNDEITCILDSELVVNQLLENIK